MDKRVLEYMAARSERAFTVGRLAQLLDMRRNTVEKIVRRLHGRNELIIASEARPKTYRIAP